jgi:quinol monooxygenase YgiN
MSVIVAGTVRVPPENVSDFRPQMADMIKASRGEVGCEAYAYAEDALEPGLMHVFEVWRDQAALEAHFQTAHMTAWRAAWPDFGVSDRRLTVYEISSQRPL